jgi:hypothetical protein
VALPGVTDTLATATWVGGAVFKVKFAMIPSAPTTWSVHCGAVTQAPILDSQPVKVELSFAAALSTIAVPLS